MSHRGIPYFTPGKYVALAQPGDWQEKALCLQIGPSLFFHEDDDPIYVSGPAKQVCKLCEVRQQCLDYALANDERFGVWGGTSERDRRKIATQRRTQGTV